MANARIRRLGITHHANYLGHTNQCICRQRKRVVYIYTAPQQQKEGSIDHGKVVDTAALRERRGGSLSTQSVSCPMDGDHLDPLRDPNFWKF